MILKDNIINNHSPLLTRFLPKLKSLDNDLAILDLACGTGRNGLFCLENNFNVCFADINKDSLFQVESTIKTNKLDSSLADFDLVDFETVGSNPLASKQYSAILVFRYLHRPLMESIKQAVTENGLVIYETFTTEQAQFGRPKNPDFLLIKGELGEIFSDWKILHSFEGIVTSDSTGQKQAIAQIVAQKI